jgi:lipoyl-dependent peroxiredoxin
VAQKQSITLPKDPIVDAEVRLGTLPSGYGISASLEISLPELDREQAQALVEQAHLVCPYSVATRGNIEVTLSLK